MRLLDTSSLALHEFFGKSIPRYAILSHRWEGEEVTFQDLQGVDQSDRQAAASFSKIRGCCSQARFDGWQYVWIDSCCIDKTSSSELSEAINSMFQWYENAEACYVYMSDVASDRDWSHHNEPDSGFRNSKWWARGWTLQELLAPNELIFYDCGWKELGTKRSLESLISSITGISREHLHNYRSASIAQKMSWAANRETTRLEDRAYSLLGIFNVSMPTLYGEGVKAFRRLQLEILGGSDDESLFAWSESLDEFHEPPGLLAESPASFANSADIVRKAVASRPSYSMTNKGLQIELSLIPADNANVYFWAPLNCARENDAGCIALVLHPARKDGSTSADLRFRRTRHLITVESPAKGREMTLLYVQQKESGWRRYEPSPVKPKQSRLAYKMNPSSLLKHGFRVIHEGSWEKLRSLKTLGSTRILRDRAEHDVDGRPTLWFLSGNDCVYLKLTSGVLPQRFEASTVPLSEEKDSFVVVLNVMHGIPLVRLLATTDAWPLEVDIDEDGMKTSEPAHRLDRVSMEMASGRSVSVALRRRIDDALPPDVSGLFLLDITIDPKGRLPWPGT